MKCRMTLQQREALLEVIAANIEDPYSRRTSEAEFAFHALFENESEIEDLTEEEID